MEGAPQNDEPAGAASQPHSANTWRAWLEASEVFIGIFDPQGKLLMANATALAAAGLLPQEVVGRHFSQITALAPVPGAAAHIGHLLEQAKRGEVVRAQITLQLRDGRLITAECLVAPLRDTSGRIVEIAGTAVPVAPEPGSGEQLLRLNRELRMLSSCVQVLIRAQEEVSLLKEVCRIIVESGGYLLAWVGFDDDDPQCSLRPIAHSGIDEGYLDQAAISWAPNARGGGPTGRAMRERTTQVCRDVQSDPAFAVWRDEAVRRGFRSSIALPLVAEDACLGVLSIYSDRIDGFDRSEVKLLEELAGDVAYGVGALRMRTERVRQQRRIARLDRILRMQSSVNSAVLRISDRDELLRESCRVAVEVGGYDHAVLVLVDADGRRAHPRFRAGGGQEFPEPAEIVLGDGTEPDTSLSSRALRTGEVTVCGDLTRSEPPVALREELIARGYKSMVALPLLVEGRRVGVLVLTSKNPDLVRDEELLLLQDMMASLAAALRSREQAFAAQLLAYFDPLTGLAKRALLCERLENMLRWRAGTLDSVSVAVFDVHHLSLINDRFGRHFGDLLLQRVAERLKSHGGADERLGYLGGGAFAVIEPHFGPDDGAVAAMLDGVFGAPFAIEGHALRVSFRSGAARYPVDAADADTLVQRAEAAVKEAKEVGEPYVHYRFEMHSEIAERLELEHRLQTAIDEQQFQLHYQPQLNLATGRIESVEALLRWKEPELGLLPPARFLPVLESTGLIVPVGGWAIARIVEDCQRWARLGLPAMRVAVNVSALQLRRKTFVQMVLDLVGALAPLAGWGLDLEITETVVLHDLETTSRKLRNLREAGLRITLDDFGTGYSALGLLPKLPLDVVKIDRSFIGGLPNDAPSALLVDSIIRLAGALKLLTIAEGVESQVQLDALRRMGCHGWQGYLYSAAIPRETLEELVQSNGGWPRTACGRPPG